MHTEEQIKLIAETLLPSFIPRDQDEKDLIFHFTIPPNKSYKVQFQKNNKNEWIFMSYEAVEEEED